MEGNNFQCLGLRRIYHNLDSGVCVYVNNRWCRDVQVVGKYSSRDIELLAVKSRSFYIERVCRHFCCLFTFHHRRITLLCWRRCTTLSANTRLLTQTHSFIVASDFNHCNFKTVLPKYYQHVCFPTRESNTLDQVYSNIKDVYKAVLRPHFGQSDHILTFSTQSLDNASSNLPL